MPDFNFDYVTTDELIAMLKNRDLSAFWLREGETNGEARTNLYAKEINQYAENETDKVVEVTLFAPGNQIQEEAVTQMLDALNNLEACVKRGYDWLSRHDLNRPVFLLELRFLVCATDFGSACGPYRIRPDKNAFSIDFTLPDSEHYPWYFTVYFGCDDLQPFASEKCLW